MIDLDLRTNTKDWIELQGDVKSFGLGRKEGQAMNVGSSLS